MTPAAVAENGAAAAAVSSSEVRFLLDGSDGNQRRTLELQHPGGDADLAFKIKTATKNGKERYLASPLVSPSSGVIHPGETLSIQVMFIEKKLKMLYQSYQRRGASVLTNQGGELMIEASYVLSDHESLEANSEKKSQTFVSIAFDVTENGTQANDFRPSLVKVRDPNEGGLEDPADTIEKEYTDAPQASELDILLSSPEQRPVSSVTINPAAEVQSDLHSQIQREVSQQLWRSMSVQDVNPHVEMERMERHSLRISKGEETALTQEDMEMQYLKEYSRTKKLSRDTFSFLVFAKIFSTPFIWGVMVFTLQILFFSLMAVEHIHPQTDNPFGIPADVDTTVRIVQFISLVVAVITQDDIRSAINLAYESYDSEAGLTKAFRGASKEKWAFSIFCRFVAGALGIFVTFLLVMTQDDSVELLLNFTAMEFVSKLDDVAFFVARQGFGGQANQDAARIMERKYRTKRSRRLTRTFLLLIIFVALLAGWITIVVQQDSSYYISDSVHVQFSDDFDSDLGTFSGVYKRVDGSMAGLSIGYADYYEVRSGGKAKLGYCHSEGAWTLTYDEKGDGSELDSCNWKAISDETASYDIMDTATSPWFTRAEGIPMKFPLKDAFHLTDTSCKFLGDAVCNGRGVCKDDSCVCNEGYFGLKCEFGEPCDTLATDIRFGVFRGNREWSTEFDILKSENDEIVVSYNRPVYYKSYKDGVIDIVMFVGRRWVVTSSEMLSGFWNKNNSVTSEGQISTVLSDYLSDFHAYYSKNKIAFTTEPVDARSPEDSATPVEKQWFRVKEASQKEMGIQSVDLTSPVRTLLLCSVCNNVSNPCLYDGVCHAGGTCKCSDAGAGKLCQIPPLGTGFCDPYFNSPGFNFDGGDCCESTCVSKDFKCGKDRTGFGDTGYYDCKLEKGVWLPDSQCGSDDPIDLCPKGRENRPIVGARLSKAGSSVALSDNGKILAIGEPGTATVRLFDKDGSHWIQRGAEVKGPAGSDFGLTMAMSGGIRHAVSSPQASVRVTLVVGAPSIGLIRVYTCGTLECLMGAETAIDPRNNSTEYADQKTASLYLHSIFAETLAMSKDGSTIVANLPHDRNDTTHPGPGNDLFIVYDWDGSNLVQRKNNVRAKGHNEREHDILGTPITQALASPMKHIGVLPAHYLSLSRNGDVLAVGDVYYRGNLYGDQWVIEYATINVEVYQWKDSGWEPRRGVQKLGNDDHFLDYFKKTYHHHSMDLSDDSLVIAVASRYLSTVYEDGSSHGHQGVKVYFWNGVDWVERDFILIWEHDLTIYPSLSVALSSDGSVLTVGRNFDPSVIETFAWNGTNYEKVRGVLDALPPTNLALSEDGSKLAVGLPESEKDQKGSVYVYTELPDSPKCDEGLALARLSFTVDDKPAGISWALKDGAGNVKLEGGPYKSVPGFTTFVHETCLDINDCFVLDVFALDNGGRFGGRYSVFLDGELTLSSRSDFDLMDRHRFGNCSSPCAEGETLSRFGFYKKDQYGTGDRFALGIEEYCTPSDDCARFYVANYENATTIFCQPGIECFHNAVYTNGIVQGQASDMWDANDPLTKVSCHAKATVKGVCNPIPIGECEDGIEPMNDCVSMLGYGASDFSPQLYVNDTCEASVYGDVSEFELFFNITAEPVKVLAPLPAYSVVYSIPYGFSSTPVFDALSGKSVSYLVSDCKCDE